MTRSLFAWLFGPLVFVVAMAAFAGGARLAGVASPVFGAASPSMAFAVAWACWWPVFKPKTGFWSHAAIGLVCAVLVLAVRVALER